MLYIAPGFVQISWPAAKSSWLQFSSLLALQLRLNDPELTLNKTKKQKLWKEKTPWKRILVWHECQDTSPWWAIEVTGNLSVSHFQDVPCQCRRGYSGGYHGEGAHGVKFICLMMWTYVGCVLTRKTPVTSVQTQIIQERVSACGGRKCVCICMCAHSKTAACVSCFILTL